MPQAPQVRQLPPAETIANTDTVRISRAGKLYQATLALIRSGLASSQDLATETQARQAALSAIQTSQYLRYSRRLQTDANGNLTVAFPANTFAAGIVPIISLDVEAPANATAPYHAQIMGPPTATGVTVKVFRSSGTISVNALATNVSLFQAPSQTWVHVTASLPSP